MTDPCDATQVPSWAATPPEQRIVDQHTAWMRANALGLRLLDITRTLSAETFGNETLRRQVISDMGSQIARDAFSRGLGVMALTPPQYQVHRHLGAWEDKDRIITPEHSEWLPASPPASMLEPNSVIGVKIEAFGFPIGKREV